MRLLSSFPWVLVLHLAQYRDCGSNLFISEPQSNTLDITLRELSLVLPSLTSIFKWRNKK